MKGYEAEMRVIAYMCASILLLCAGCRSQLQNDIRKFIGRAHDSSMIEMRYVTGFEWKHLYIFGPYTGADEIEKILGFSWPPAHSSGIELSDSFCLLVFLNQTGVVDYVAFPRGQGDFSQVSQQQPYSPETAIFRVSQRQDGVPLLLPSVDTQKKEGFRGSLGDGVSKTSQESDPVLYKYSYAAKNHPFQAVRQRISEKFHPLFRKNEAGRGRRSRFS